VSSSAYRRTTALICSGTDGHWPRHSRRPASSTAQTAVIFCETSKPTKWVIRDVEDLLAERGIVVSYETVRRWVNHFGPMVAGAAQTPTQTRYDLASTTNSKCHILC